MQEITSSIGKHVAVPLISNSFWIFYEYKANTTQGWLLFGRVNVNSGTLDLPDYSQTSGELRVAAGASVGSIAMDVSGGVLSGDGTFLNDVNNSGGAITPGTSAGQLTFNSNLQLGSGSELVMEIFGLVATSEYDVISVADSLSVDGLLTLEVEGGFESSIAVDDTFTLATSGNLTGAFANVVNGGVLQVGLVMFDVHYGDGSLFDEGNVVVSVASITNVPEPGALPVLAIISMVILRRRRH